MNSKLFTVLMWAMATIFLSTLAAKFQPRSAKPTTPAPVPLTMDELGKMVKMIEKPIVVTTKETQCRERLSKLKRVEKRSLFFQDPADCSKFYQCQIKLFSTFSCPENYKFDIAQKMCLRGKDESCPQGDSN